MSETALVETGSAAVKPGGCSLLAKIIIGVSVSVIIAGGAATAGYFLSAKTDTFQVPANNDSNSLNNTTYQLTDQTTIVPDINGDTSVTRDYITGQTTNVHINRATSDNIGDTSPYDDTTILMPETTLIPQGGQTTPSDSSVSNNRTTAISSNVHSTTDSLDAEIETTSIAVNGQTTAVSSAGDASTIMSGVTGHISNDRTTIIVPGQTTNFVSETDNTAVTFKAQTTVGEDITTIALEGQATTSTVIAPEGTTVVDFGRLTTVIVSGASIIPSRDTPVVTINEITSNNVLGVSDLTTNSEDSSGLTSNHPPLPTSLSTPTLLPPTTASTTTTEITTLPTTLLPTTTENSVCPIGRTRTVIFVSYVGSGSVYLRGEDTPLSHRSLGSFFTEYDRYATGDTMLTWGDREGGQPTDALGTPTAITSSSPTDSNYHPLNTYGSSYLMTDVCMDCSAKADSRFQFKLYSSGWESLRGNNPNCLRSGNHLGECGKINVFTYGTLTCQMLNFP